MGSYTPTSPSPKTQAADAKGDPPEKATDDAAAPPAVSPLVLQTRTLGVEQEEVRRPSIQFVRQGLPRGSSPKPGIPRQTSRRRLSSPPPPPAFEPRVSFDTFDKPADFIEDNSFTLPYKHRDYTYTKRSRTFLCGLDSNDYSEYALEWLLDELVDDGDQVVCLRVVDKDSSIAADYSVEQGKYRKEAEDLMKQIQTKNQDKAISLVLEFSVGKVNKVIEDMINLYEPAILIVGTRGRSLGGFQGLLPGSVSKYCLQHSPVPVIVVRQNSKRAKTKRKRMQDPSRQSYRDILGKSGLEGGHPIDLSHRNSFILEDSQPASDAEGEAAAVAAAIGYKPQAAGPPGPSPLSRGRVAKPGDEEEPTSPDGPYSTGGESPESLRSPGVVMKSPEMQNLDSPNVSDLDDSDWKQFPNMKSSAKKPQSPGRNKRGSSASSRGKKDYTGGKGNTDPSNPGVGVLGLLNQLDD